MVPGEARYINTLLKFITCNKTSIICETPKDMLFKSKLRVHSSTTFRDGTEDGVGTEYFKFMLHNNEVPINYPVKVPGDIPRSMDSNKIKLINGQEIPTSEFRNELVASNSYLIRKDDVIARIIITKLGDE
jgi:hypothetical protein